MRVIDLNKKAQFLILCVPMTDIFKKRAESISFTLSSVHPTPLPRYVKCFH